jgi:hypothetical protein
MDDMSAGGNVQLESVTRGPATMPVTVLDVFPVPTWTR